jgi:hypothetical protein
MPANIDDACVVYWVKDETCVDPYTDGYVGITKHFKRRSRAHLKRWPGKEIMVLFEGTRAQCAHEESKYRPRPNIGWNGSNGGGRWRKAPNPSVIVP